MALIQCDECEKEISDKAPACPQCGALKEAEPASQLSVSEAVEMYISNLPSGDELHVYEEFMHLRDKGLSEKEIFDVVKESEKIRAKTISKESIVEDEVSIEKEKIKKKKKKKKRFFFF